MKNPINDTRLLWITLVVAVLTVWLFTALLLSEHGRADEVQPVGCKSHWSEKRGIEITRCRSTVRAFRADHPCPSTGHTIGSCPGWVVDHIAALECGGPDDPANLQWQSVEEAKKKDRWEGLCQPR